MALGMKREWMDRTNGMSLGLADTTLGQIRQFASGLSATFFFKLSFCCHSSDAPYPNSEFSNG
jgi:hypothetical protein